MTTTLDTLAGTSLVETYLDAHPETRHYLHSTLMGKLRSGDDLVDKHLAPMIDAVYRQIRDLVDPGTLTQAQARMYIEELGERGKVPAHYILYTNALLSDLGLLVNGHVPAPETATLVLLHQVLVNSHMPGIIAGGYYATEGVAIAETEILRDITNRYGQLTSGTSGKDLKALTYYYDLHLDEDHEAAQVGGLSVEAAHIEGLAQFIRKSELYGLDLPQATEGFLQIFNGMTHWWTQLAYRARDLN